MAKHYSMETDAETTAKALGYELSMSPKDSYEVCKAIRGMKLKAAEKYLEDVLDHKKAIPFTRYKGKIKHRVGKMGPGGYPEKAVGYILKVLKNAENNAEYKGLDPENMYVHHSAANRGRVLHGGMPRAHGRTTQWNEQTTTIEIIVKEKGGKKVKEKPAETKVEAKSTEPKVEEKKEAKPATEAKPKAESKPKAPAKPKAKNEAKAAAKEPKASPQIAAEKEEKKE